MAVEIIMPKMGMGMEEGTVVEWLKQKGDSVKKGESVVSISSDKIEKELEAPEEGVLIEIEADVDDIVPIGKPLGYIGSPGESINEPGEPTSLIQPTQEDSDVPTVEINQATAIASEEEPRLRVSPAARRLSKIMKVNLSTVTGSGPLGRITKADVEHAANTQKVEPENKTIEIEEKPSATPPSIGGTTKRVTGMRKVISERMFQSLQQTAQLTLQTTADVTELLAFQKKAREAYQINDEVRLTITDFIAKAAINALLDHKEMNSLYQGDSITTFDSVHLGVAIALPEGLVVPVIQDADRKSLSAISREIRKASKLARASEMNQLQLNGSTFTITSLGTYGIGFFTPVLNPPEVGILGVGTISEQPVYFGDELKKRSMLPLSLTFDHRAIDGAPAASFLAAIKANLEKPFKLVL
ncbi:dihydrolipoamide acetyltransferase family protein [Sporolactobacillus kofuensis]|uniref:Dihydrolipoamide acetyltransferase component of pyruvate dehydrogenase complex n=1 Tax=Sporolactobacillus kofuensis TaxID=269672 RepID=A0ABW1WEI8_9BACL|nr:dihydrolipoamide acetyltransferase family protein [Sporolactobacillus kofuensis]MCO7176660.1 2-oxo acid dehydrogenase subunit E2 [Sporolactobacillus kofuensis]